jgi:hypothetical protein
VAHHAELGCPAVAPSPGQRPLWRPSRTRARPRGGAPCPPPCPSSGAGRRS